jgi:hypothetical protein
MSDKKPIRTYINVPIFADSNTSTYSNTSSATNSNANSNNNASTNSNTTANPNTSSTTNSTTNSNVNTNINFKTNENNSTKASSNTTDYSTSRETSPGESGESVVSLPVSEPSLEELKKDAFNAKHGIKKIYQGKNPNDNQELRELQCNPRYQKELRGAKSALDFLEKVRISA